MFLLLVCGESLNLESEEFLQKRLLYESKNPVLWEEILVFYDRRLRLQEGYQQLIQNAPEDRSLRKYLGDFFWNRNQFELALENYAWLRFLDPRGKSGLKRLQEIAQLFSLYRPFFSSHSEERYLVCNTLEKKTEFFPLFLYLAFRDIEVSVRQKASQTLQLEYHPEAILPWVLSFFSKMTWMDWDTWHPFLLKQSLFIQKKTLIAMAQTGIPEAFDVVSMYLKTLPFSQNESDWIYSHFPQIS